MSMSEKMEQFIRDRIHGELAKRARSIGFLTDEEKVSFLELETIEQQIDQLSVKLSSKRKMFWASIENRTETYGVHLHLNNQTGEITAIEKPTKEQFEECVVAALKGTPFEGMSERFSLGDEEYEE